MAQGSVKRKAWEMRFGRWMLLRSRTTQQVEPTGSAASVHNGRERMGSLRPQVLSVGNQMPQRSCTEQRETGRSSLGTGPGSLFGHIKVKGTIKYPDGANQEVPAGNNPRAT